MEISHEIIEKIKNLPTPSIVAISGFGGAGKSTAAHKLAELFDAPVVGIDQFMKDRTREDYSHWEGMDFARFEKEVLLPFTKGENPIHYGHWDHGANNIIKSVEVPHKGILIVEGVGIFRPELIKYFNYKIWIDCPQEEANSRGKKRDREVHKNPQDKNWDGLWKRNDAEYFNTYRPQELADYVLRNC
jgi:uridine kinase